MGGGCATRPRPTCAASSTTSSFIVSKEVARPTSRAIQRQLRDHYRGHRANQTTRSLNESLQRGSAAAKLEENEGRATRVKELERQLNILRQVTEHAGLKTLSPQPEAQPGTHCQVDLAAVVLKLVTPMSNQRIRS